MFKKLFTPFQEISKISFLIIVVVQVIITLVLLHFFHSEIVPSPLTVFTAFIDILSSESFYMDLWKSVIFTLQAMGIAIVVSALVSYMSTIQLFFPLAKFISLCRYLTITGLTYVFTIMSQDSHSLKINILLFGIVPFFTISMLSVIATVPKEEYKLCKTLGMSDWKTLYEIIIIGRLDSLFEVLRQNFAICWMMITTAEGLSMSEGGIGTIIIKSAKYLDMSKVLAALLVIFLIGVLFDWSMRKLSKLLFPYAV